MRERKALSTILRICGPILLSVLVARLLANPIYYLPRHTLGWINLAIVLTGGLFTGCSLWLIALAATNRLRHPVIAWRRRRPSAPEKPEFFVGVVDDEPTLVDALVRILELNDLKACALYSGEAAVQLAKQACPSAFVMGVFMPGMDGITAACEILKSRPECQFLFMSGHPEKAKSHIKTLADKGYAFKLLEKPGPPATIVAWVQAWKLIYEASPFKQESSTASAATGGATN